MAKKKHTKTKKKQTTQVRLTITANAANAAEAENLKKWVSDFVDQAHKAFPFKTGMKLASEQIFSKPKDPPKRK